LSEALVLELDTQAERSVSRLRAVSALVVGVSSVAILIGARGTLSVVIGLLGLGASIGWVFAYRSSGKRVKAKAEYFLRLDDEGLTLARGPKRRTIAWTEIEKVSVSEERLVLELTLRDGTLFDVPPIFRGYGLYELEDLVNARREAAPTPLDG